MFWIALSNGLTRITCYMLHIFNRLPIGFGSCFLFCKFMSVIWLTDESVLLNISFAYTKFAKSPSKVFLERSSGLRL